MSPLNVNDGSRPSRFALSQIAAGERDPEAVPTLDADARAELDAIEASRDRVRPFDAGALRLRAAQQAPPRLPAAANGTMAWLVPILAVAAALLVAVLQPGPSEGEHRGSTFRAGSSLAAFELGDDGRLAPYSGAPLDAEAVLGFKVRADGHRSVVVLSVDGEGTVSVFWPEQGDVGEPLTGSGLVALPGTVVLDAAPGPEVFMAVYDMPVAQARDLARRTWQAGGHGALAELARTRAHVDAVAVERAR